VRSLQVRYRSEADFLILRANVWKWPLGDVVSPVVSRGAMTFGPRA
jgi:hypothetical protein